MSLRFIGSIGLLSCAVAVVVACGGSTFEPGSGGSSGSASGGKSGSTSSGGASGSGATGGGGSGGSAGSAGGGSGATGGTVGVGGSGGSGGGGAGGSVGGIGGVGGSGGSGAIGDCVAGDSCALMPTNCCGYCGDAPLSSYDAVNSARVNEWNEAVCGPNPPPCLACVVYENPNYTALCRDSVCRAIDVRTDELGACAIDTDCRLRWGASCCERCGGGDGSALTAVSARVSFEEAVCGENWGCPECLVAPYPDNASAKCSAGQCVVVIAL